MTVGEKIKYYRESREMSVTKLAERAGLAVDNIRKYESGARNPKLEALNKIAIALGININTLLDAQLKTAADCAPYLIRIGDAGKVKFVGEKVDGRYTKDVAIQFENESLQNFIRDWANYVDSIEDLRKKASDTLDDETKKYMLERAEYKEKNMEPCLMDKIPFTNAPDGKFYTKMTPNLDS